MSPDVVSVTLRAAGFVALLQAVGIVIFVTLWRDRITQSSTRIRRLGLFAALAGVLLLLAHQGIEAAHMADDFSGMFDGDLQRLSLASSGGVAHFLQVLGLSLLAMGLWRPNRFGFAAIAGATLAILAFAITGHTRVQAMRWLLAPLLVIHILIIAFWFGALAPLWLVSKHETLNDAIGILHQFSRIATWLVPGILVAGLAMAITLVPNLQVLQQPYGQLLAAKLVGFGLLMGLAASNKWRLVPALEAGRAGAAAQLRRAIGSEYLLIIAVLSVTAVMTAFYSPN